MTKEELKEEAEDYANRTRIKDKNTYVSFDDECISSLQDYEGNYMDISERIVKTYIDSAEPREKRIVELEAQIEKMKCCSNCVYLAGCDLSGYEECKNFDKWELREIKEND